MPRSAWRAAALAGAQHHRAGAVAEQHAGAAVVPVEDAREGLGADHQRACAPGRAQEVVGDRQRIDEAGADRLHVEGGAARHAERGLHRGGGGRKGLVGRGGREHDQVDVAARAMPGVRPAPRRRRWVARSEVISPSRRDVALADAGALADPLVGGVEALREFGVADDLAGR